MNGDIGEVRIRADRLVKRFGDFVAVNDVSFEARRGEIMGFLGPNGAGKSTTIRILCGLLRPSGGRAEVAGFDVARDPEKVRENIGYMSQKFSLYDDLSVRENLRFFGGIYGVKGARLRERLAFAVAMAGLEGREDALVGDLSGGWKQRLALGCAVLHEPAILFLDEPTSGVDPASRRRFWDLIYALAGEGVSVVITTHYMDEAEYCNRIALINGGRLVALGSPRELKRGAIRGEILLVEGDDLGAMLEALQGAPGVRDVAPFGSSLHIVVEDAARDRAAIEARLAERGLAWSRIEPIKATLEDVFVQLVGGDGREGGSHEPAPDQGGRQEGDHPDPARSAQPDGRAADAAHADGAARLRGQHGHQARADLRVRSRGQPAERGAAQGVPGLAIFRHRRDRARLRRRRPGDRRGPLQDGDRRAARFLAKPRLRQRRLGAGDPRRHRRQHRQHRARLRPGGGRRLFRQRPARRGLRAWASLQPVVPAVAQYRVWYNEDLVSRNFIMPGVVALVMALVGAQLTSLTISREWERGTMEVLVSTPVTRMELMVGKILPYFFIGLVDAALCLLIAVFWFEAPFRGAVSTLFLTTSLFLVVVLGIGYFISASIRSQVGASQIALVATLLPTTLLSGFAFPIEQMPTPIQWLTYLVPARYYFTILKSVFLKGSGARRPHRADRLARALRRGHRASRRPGVSQDAGLGRCGAASSTWS